MVRCRASVIMVRCRASVIMARRRASVIMARRRASVIMVRCRAFVVDCFSFYRSRAAQAAESKGGIIKLSFGRLAPPRFCWGIEAKAQDTFLASIFY